MASWPNGPADAPWLDHEEKEAIAGRLAAEVPPGQRAFWLALRDPRVLACGLASFGLFIGLFGVGLWLPQIVQAMGFSNRATGFIVALPYLVSTGAMIIWARSSDAKGDSIRHAALSALVAAAGFVGASLAQSDLLVLVALTCTAVGVLSTFSPLSSLVKSFLSGPAAASGLALYNAISSVGGFTGPYIIGALREESGTYSSRMATSRCFRRVRHTIPSRRTNICWIGTSMQMPMVTRAKQSAAGEGARFAGSGSHRLRHSLSTRRHSPLL